MKDNSHHERISHLAYIEPGATLGKNVTIEPFACVKKNVILHDNVIVKSHAYIDGHTTIGEGSVIWPGASIGTKPQDLKYRGEISYVHIGKNCEIREYATINSSCQEGSVVKVGDSCLIMAYCHVAHNCELGNRVIMANAAMLAGHVIVEDHAIIGGMTPVHQYCRIGCHAMVGGFSRVTHDVPPYTIGNGYEPWRFGGLNLVGLKRHNFPLHVRRELRKAFIYTFRKKLRLEEALFMIEHELELYDEVKHWIDFCRSTKRGIIGLSGITQEKEESLDTDEEEEALSSTCSV